MSNEIAFNPSITVRNGYLVEQFAPGQILLDQDDPVSGGYAQNIGTSEEVVDFGDADYTYGALMVLRNLDETNWVEVGPNSGGSMITSDRLFPGMVAIHCLAPGAVYRAQADTAACTLLVQFWPFAAAYGT
tara:strand:- start:107 stop:499 length:393 start_codon:yes stop_codon:yes gene_type:complete